MTGELMNKKLSVCLILPCALPVPAVRGGAVETLTESIIYYNSMYSEMNLTVVSIYDCAAVERSKNYRNVEWIFVKKNVLIKYSDYLFRVLRRITKHSFRISLYDYIVLDKIKDKRFDKVVFEGGNVFFAKKYMKYYRREDICFHFHSLFRPKYDIRTYVGSTISVSEYLNRRFLEHTDFSQANTKVLLNGIETKKFSKEPKECRIRELREKYGIQEADFVLIFVGRLIKGKGVLELIQAVKDIDDKNLKLIIAGAGTSFNKGYIDNINKYVTSMKNIIMTGYVPNDKLYELYHLADCAVMPSICEEGAGLVQLEAYAAGIPAIVCDRGGGIGVHNKKWFKNC